LVAAGARGDRDLFPQHPLASLLLMQKFGEWLALMWLG